MSALQKIANRFRPAAGPAGSGLIGAHFSLSKLHLVQLDRTPPGALALRAHASEPFIDGRQQVLSSRKAVKTLVKRALKQAPFSGRRIISTMPIEHVKLMSISYPASSPDAEPATIAGLMNDRVEGDLADYVIDYVPVRTSIRDGERLCIVAVSKRDHVMSYLNTLNHAGLQVEALEVAPLSVRRLIECMSSPSNIENTLAINTGKQSTYLTLISGRRLLANQEIDFGEAQVVDAISKTLDISEAVAADLLASNGLDSSSAGSRQEVDDLSISGTLLEIVRPAFLKLVREIERAFLYAASESYGQAGKRVFLFGRLTQWAGADTVLDSLLGLPVQRMSEDLLPFDSGEESIGMMNHQSAAEISVASGLALWGMNTHD